jgi:putative SOS response-associated peptidase YedK
MWRSPNDDQTIAMCGRVIQSSGPLRYAIVDGLNVRDVHNYPPRWNAVPSQELVVVRRNQQDRRGLAEPRFGGASSPTGARTLPAGMSR